MVTQPTFTRFPTWAFDESWQSVADGFVSVGPSPQIQIIVKLKEKKTRKSHLNIQSNAIVNKEIDDK